MIIILGSKSKWRQDIAEKHLGIPVQIFQTDFDEKQVVINNNPKTPEEHVQLIAKGKLNSIKNKRKEINPNQNEIILCYDTIVYCNGIILEKPTNKGDLAKMVNLWGKQNVITSIYTAVSIGKLNSDDTDYNTVLRAEVKFIRNFTEKEYMDYINDDWVSSSSGGYIVEKLLELNLVKIIEGSIDIIQGFPIEVTKQAVSKFMEN